MSAGRSISNAARPGVERPGDDHADRVEPQEAPKCHHRPAGQRDRRVVSLGNEEGTIGGNGRGEGDDCSTFTLGLFAGCGRVQIRQQTRDLVAHDRADHLKGGRIANSGQHEQHHEAGEKAGEVAAGAAGRQKGDDAESRHEHAQKGPEGDPPAAKSVADPARTGAAERTDKRAKEHILQRVRIGEHQSGQQRKTRRITDEAAECASIQHAISQLCLRLKMIA